MAIVPDSEKTPRRRRHSADAPLSLRMAEFAGLTDEAKTRHLNVKVQPKLFEAAARRAGSTSPAVVIEVALAALATQDDLGPWLARNWGSLKDLDPETMAILDEVC